MVSFSFSVFDLLRKSDDQAHTRLVIITILRCMVKWHLVHSQWLTALPLLFSSGRPSLP